ncbi:hypothetical protein UFOVP650_15 [uncultured Caudovirales phage]|uniref:Uncharacterized protein n=1 Tax=uncultured Caudovirales phage TaxID=2100421 RepID=A0A6J5NAT3_9CAUD|nr:hypothetical protein UFOVP650_15 [uncultured Caudovirales phage]
MKVTAAMKLSGQCFQLEDQFTVMNSRRDGKTWDPFSAPDFVTRLRQLQTTVSPEVGEIEVKHARVAFSGSAQYPNSTLLLRGTMQWSPATWGLELYPKLQNLCWFKNVAMALAKDLSSAYAVLQLTTPAVVTLEEGTPLLFGAGTGNQVAFLAEALRIGSQEAYVQRYGGSLGMGLTIPNGTVFMVPDLGHARLVKAVQMARVATPHQAALPELAPKPKYVCMSKPELRQFLQNNTEFQWRPVFDSETQVRGIEYNGTLYTTAEDSPSVRRTAARVLLGEL